MFFPMQYKRVVWGLVIALLDIRIGPFDIVPDFMGYILITMGLSELVEQNAYYGKAKNFSQWLILFSLPDLYKFSGYKTHFSIISSGMLLMIISMAGVVIKMFMVYYICRAIADISLEKGLDELGSKANSRWKTYFFINGAMLVLMPFTVSMGQISSVLVIPVIAALIVEIILISLVNTAGKEFA